MLHAHQIRAHATRAPILATSQPHIPRQTGRDCSRSEMPSALGSETQRHTPPPQYQPWPLLARTSRTSPLVSPLPLYSQCAALAKPPGACPPGEPEDQEAVGLANRLPPRAAAQSKANRQAKTRQPQNLARSAKGVAALAGTCGQHRGERGPHPSNTSAPETHIPLRTCKDTPKLIL